VNNNTLRGHFNSMEDLVKNAKAINILHTQNGYYEFREVRVFGGCVKSDHVYDLAPPPREGIFFKIPQKIPAKILRQVISFFRDNCKVANNEVNEVMVQIYYNFDTDEYFTVVPEQRVKLARIDYKSTEVDESSDLVVTIHSHPVFKACFSDTDNRDEKATGLYAVIGHLEKPMPDILLRASIGGNFVTVPVWDVFEDIFHEEYPIEWHDNVTIVPSTNEEMHREFVGLYIE